MTADVSSSKRVTLREAIHLCRKRCHYLAMNAAYTPRPIFGANAEDLGQTRRGSDNWDGAGLFFFIRKFFIESLERATRSKCSVFKRAHLPAGTGVVST
jgi:hypothetical protein